MPQTPQTLSFRYIFSNLVNRTFAIHSTSPRAIFRFEIWSSISDKIPQLSRRSELIDENQQSLTIKRIDQLQEQLLEDLNRLNVRIENIIDLYNQNRRNSSDSAAIDVSPSAA